VILWLILIFYSNSKFQTLIFLVAKCLLTKSMCRTSAYIYRSFFQLIVQWWRKQVFKPFLTNKKLSIIGQDFENFYRDIFMNNSDKSYSEIWSPCMSVSKYHSLFNKFKASWFFYRKLIWSKEKKLKNFYFFKNAFET
jgi:hypothetical protein